MPQQSLSDFVAAMEAAGMPSVLPRRSELTSYPE